jgi:TPR repeat protein
MAPSRRSLARHILAALVVVAGLLAAPAADAARVALVVGNSSYVALPQLRNPANDSALLSEALTGIGFEVVRVNDVDQQGLLAAVERFGEIARGAEVAVFYFAGHGVQFGGSNYLLPIGATLGSEADLRAQGLDVDLVVEKFKAAGPRSGVLILDACRDNPLPVSVAGQTRGLKVAALTSGLARVEGVSGIVIAYATAPGQVAYDGAGANSPFVAALAHYLGEPGLGISDLFIRVRQRVMESTAGAQIPWVEEALLEPLYMHPAEAQPAPQTDVAKLNGALEIEEPEKKLAALVDLEGALDDPTMQPVVADHIERLREEEEEPTEAPSVRLVRELVDWHRLRIIKSEVATRLAAGAFLALYPQSIFVDRAGKLAAGDAAGPAGEVSEEDAESVWTLVAQADQPALFDRFMQEIPSDRFAELAQARRTIWLADLTGPSLLPPEVVPDTPTATDTTPPSADRSTDTAPPADRTTVPVFVGTGPTAIALPMSPALLQVAAPPKYGTLILERDDGTVAEVRSATSGEPTAVRALSYRPDVQARDAVDEFVIAALMPTGRGLSIANQAQTDTQAEAQTGTPPETQPTGSLTPPETQPTGSLTPPETQTAQSAPMTVRADIKPHECDIEAGARFDTQGVVAGNYSTEVKPDKAIPACRQAVAAFPDVARFRYQLGRALYAAGEYEESAEVYRQAVDGGHIAALYELGRQYERGEGVAKDLAEALRLYKDAAMRNDLYSATRLGVLYRDGIGVERDIHNAVGWLVKAARGGHTFAYNHLGYMYLEGNGVEKDDERAYRLFEASANAGDVYGFNNMGLMYERGAHVKADPAQAIVWYEKAARGGQPQAPINLGLMYLGGRGVDADPARAAYWFAEAAKLGNAWGFTNLGWLYQTGKGVDSDPELAADLYARALRLDPEGEAGAAAAKNFADVPRKAAVRLIQVRLIALGFGPGEPDGAWGGRTREAVRAFAAAEAIDLPADAPPIRILVALLDAADRKAVPAQ